MISETFPKSINEIATWSKNNNAPIKEGRIRFIQFVVLEALSSSADHKHFSYLSFKGGNCLRFIYENDRSTIDLDFTAEKEFPDSPEIIRNIINEALLKTESKYLIKARVQRIRREPPSIEKTMPTYQIKIGFQIRGDRYYQNFNERIESGKFLSEVIEIEISINDVLCETNLSAFSDSESKIRVCSLEDIISEKLRALLQQPIRNRYRPQDVFDIASMVKRYEDKLNFNNISNFVVKKCVAKNIIPTKNSFNEEIKSRAELNYDSEIKGYTNNFIPFNDAWDEVAKLVSRLTIS